MIRHYHGHLSGVYSLALHPTLDVLMTGGRDSVCRVWDMRTKCAPLGPYLFPFPLHAILLWLAKLLGACNDLARRAIYVLGLIG